MKAPIKEPINQLDPQERLHGVWEGYWSDGTLRQRGHWLHGTPHGVWERYYRNGTISSKFSLSYGKFKGLETRYSLSGILEYKGYHLGIK
jgi:antitoxin component YwqK of YwqJK toxin-antitoxin module